MRAWHNVATMEVHVLIRDDGIGFDQEDKQRGRGLTNLEMRAQALDGILTLRTARSGAERGTSIELRLPVHAQANHFKAADEVQII